MTTPNPPTALGEEGEATFRPNGADIALMEEVYVGNVSWNKRSFRLWQNDQEYSLVTAIAARLVKHGYLKKEMTPGYSYVQRGPVELTRLGREVLRAT